MIDRKRENAIFMLVVLVTIWGTTFTITQEALGDVSPVLMGLSRFVLSFFLFMIFSPAARSAVAMFLHPTTLAERQLRSDGVILGLVLSAGYILQFVGLETTTTAKSAFLTSTTVIWTPIIAVMIGGVRLHILTLFAISIAVVGIGLLTNPFPIEGIVVGDLYTIGCAVAFGWYIFWLDRALPRTILLAQNEEHGVQMIAALQLFAGSLWMLPALLLDDIRFSITANSTFAILYTTIFATALSTYMQSKYQKEVTPVAATLIYTLEPVVATIVAYIFVHERLTTTEWVGAGFIIVGMLLGQVGDKR